MVSYQNQLSKDAVKSPNTHSCGSDSSSMLLSGDYLPLPAKSVRGKFCKLFPPGAHVRRFPLLLNRDRADHGLVDLSLSWLVR